jgi:hypothetical protein
MGSEPSGRRSAHSIAARASSGIQAAGKALPQLIPDGLTPGEHVAVAMNTCHPLQLTPTLFPPVAYATNNGLYDNEECNAQRTHMLKLVTNMAHALDDEKQEAVAACNPIVAEVLTQNNFARHIPLQRGLAYVFNIPDWGAVPSLMCGLPMVGHAVLVPGVMCRNKPPICSIQDVIGRSKKNNYKMICQAVATGDAKLDETAWSKNAR